MSYIALARKWRPRTFSQLVGQEHITKALINSLNQQRLHHAYLFTGTRGVGKTSIARILAKALNCEQGLCAEPCLKCDACLAIEKGAFVDLIEVDGASRTRVEDTRELLENIHYAPTHGRFKIYLIDEVHMLSQHSFNALLKTLEEPPAHVKFLLATTDPQKLPVTVLSRCLQFNLKHLDKHIIGTQLKLILDNEQLSYESSAVDLLAHAANGSMRDALSLLDQAIAGIETKLSIQGVKNILGYTQIDYALQLLNALSKQSPEELINISRHIAEEGGYFQYTLDEMLNYLHQISINQHLNENHPLICLKPEVQALSAHFSKEDAQLFYQIALKGREEMHLAPTLAIGFEMTLLRMYTFQPQQVCKTPPLTHQSIKLPETTTATVPEKMPLIEPEKSPEPCPVTVIEPVPETSVPASSDTWIDVLEKLNLTGLALNAIGHAELIEKSYHNIVLRVATGHLSLFTPTTVTRIEAELSRYYAENIKITLNSEATTQRTPAQQKEISRVNQQQEAAAALENDPFFQQLKQTFSAELVKNSIASVKDDL